MAELSFEELFGEQPSPQPEGGQAMAYEDLFESEQPSADVGDRARQAAKNAELSNEDVLSAAQRLQGAFKFGGLFSPGGVDFLRKSTGGAVLPVTNPETGEIEDILIDPRKGAMDLPVEDRQLRSVRRSRDWGGFVSEFGPELIRTAAPIAGAIAGGASGSVVPGAGTTVGGLAGAAGGAAAGEAVVQGIGALLPGEEQATAGERIGQGAFNTGIELVVPFGETAVRTAGRKALSAIGVPLRQSAEQSVRATLREGGQEAVEAQATARRAGVDTLTPGQATGADEVLAAEDAVRNITGGREVAERGFQRQQDQLASTIETRLARAAEVDPAEAGERLARVYTRGKSALESRGKRAASELFAAAEKAAGGREAVGLQNTKRALGEMIEQYTGRGKARDAASAYAKQLRRSLDELPDNVGPRELQSLMESYGAAARAFSKSGERARESRMANAVLDGLRRDLDSAAETLDLPEGQLLKQARDVFRQTKQAVDRTSNTVLEGAFRSAGILKEGAEDDAAALLAQPEIIAKRILSSSQETNNRRLVSTLSKMDGGEKALKDIRAAVFQELMESSSPSGAFSTQRFLTNASKKKGALRGLLGREEFGLLEDVMETARLINRRSNVGGGGSRTAPLARMLARVGGVRSRVYQGIPLIGDTLGKALADMSDERNARLLAEAMFDSAVRQEWQSMMNALVKNRAKKAFEREFPAFMARVIGGETDPASEPADARRVQEEFFDFQGQPAQFQLDVAPQRQAPTPRPARQGRRRRQRRPQGVQPPVSNTNLERLLQ